MRKVGVLVFLCSFILISMYTISESIMEETAVPVTVIETSTKDIYDTVKASGQIEETITRNVYSDGTAVVKNIYVSEGDEVYKNQVLMEIEYTSDDAVIPSEIGEIEEIMAVLNSFGIDYDTAQDMYERIAGEASIYLPYNLFTEGRSGQTTFITSPITGIVTKLPTKNGSIARNGTLCAVVSDFSKLTLRVPVLESFINGIEESMPVSITGEAFKDHTFDGYVERIMPVAKRTVNLTGSSSTTVDVLISVDNKDMVLKPGYSASVRIFKSLLPQRITVPYESIIQGSDNREAVFVVKNGRAVKTYIETGLELEDEAEARLGLAPGDLVILDPPEDLTSGTLVTVTRKGE